MSNYIYPSSLLCDFYKVGHIFQYPEGTEYVYSNLTPRSTYIEGVNKIIFFGLQSFAKKFLIKYFNDNFFSRPKQDVIDEYVRVLKYTLGIENPDTTHIGKLHDIGYLPLKIKALKEGTLVPLQVPTLTIENTHPDFFWVTNFIETLMSSEIWLPCTSATISYEFRKIMSKYALETVGNTGFVPFQGHDFSFRGMSSVESAKLGGAGHLLNFVGTDTIPAILFHEEFYGANIEKELVGTSVSATEHSIACSYGVDNEFGYYERLIKEVYPSGIVSLVSDTYDLWEVLTDILVRLKDDIMARDGKVVIRPDSGNPVLILCGDPHGTTENERKGVIQLLWEVFGGTINELGYKELDPHIGAIYGDSINLERCEAICEGLKENGFASTNVVFGIGSFSYQFQTRDTFGFAVKATHVVINGEERFIQKDPATDTNKTKKSATGRVVVVQTDKGLKLADGLTIQGQKELEICDLLEDVFIDGRLVREETLAEIRERIAATL